MATGYTFFPTAGEIVKASLGVLRVIDLENPNHPTAAQYAEGILALNYLLTGWQSHKHQIWCRKTANFTLSQGKVQYSIGQGGYDVNVQIPLKVYQAWRTDNSGSTPIDIPLQILSEKEYLLLPNKNEEGTPIAIWYDPKHEYGVSGPGTFAYGLVNLYYPADATNATNCTVSIRYQRPVNNLDATTDQLEFPQEWFDAIKYNLAIRQAHLYGTPQLEYDRINALAKDLKEDAMAFDTEDSSLFLYPAHN